MSLEFTYAVARDTLMPLGYTGDLRTREEEVRERLTFFPGHHLTDHRMPKDEHEILCKEILPYVGTSKDPYSPALGEIVVFDTVGRGFKDGRLLFWKTSPSCDGITEGERSAKGFFHVLERDGWCMRVNLSSRLVVLAFMLTPRKDGSWIKSW